jgi:hypothetical protein
MRDLQWKTEGFGALDVPPKCEKQRIQRGPIYRLAGHWLTFKRK